MRMRLRTAYVGREEADLRKSRFLSGKAGKAWPIYVLDIYAQNLCLHQRPLVDFGVIKNW